jgi:hypothetical protein
MRQFRTRAGGIVGDCIFPLKHATLIPVSGASDFVRYELTRRMRVERWVRIANANDIAASINDTTAHGERFRSGSRGNRSAAGRVVEGRRQGQE